MTPAQIFSLGCGPFLFRKKEMVCKKSRSWPGSFRTHFFLDGPKKKRFRAAKEKGPWESLGQNSSPPGAGERCEKAGSATARLRRYRVMLSGQIQTPSGRPPQSKHAGAPEGCRPALKAAGRQGVTPGRRTSR